MFRLKLFAVLLALAPMLAHAGQVAERVKAAGSLPCGIIMALNDFTKDDTHGPTDEFGTDICRAVAAALFGDPDRARIDGFADEARGYQALQSGKIELLVGVSLRPGLAKRYQAAFGQPVFFDGQGFMVHARSGIARLADLAGKQVCFIGGTDAEATAMATFERHGIKVLPFPFEEMGEMEAALVADHCQAETHDVSTLAADRAGFHSRVHDFSILAEQITLDPLVPAVPANDTDWLAIVDWTMHALVQAEISGITRANVEQMRNSTDPTISTLLGTRRGLGYTLGLPDDWALKAIKAVGNYGEVFDRDLGEGSEYGLARGVNRPWTEGGLLWSPPFR